MGIRYLLNSSASILTLVFCALFYPQFELCVHAFQKPRNENLTQKEKSRRDKESVERRSAIIRLQAAGEKAKTLDDSIAKTGVLASVADALWEQNETRARALFTAAFESIEGIKLDPKFDQREAVAQRRGGKFGPLFQLRSSVLERVARRDFKLAETLRESVNTRSEASENDGVRKAELSQLYLNLAVAIAKTRPEEALRLLRLSFNEINPPLIFALLRIRSDNPRLADQVFVEALSSTSATASDHFGSFAIYVLPTEEDRFYGRHPMDDPSRAVSIKAFLDYVFTRLNQTASNSAGTEIDAARIETIYRTLKEILPLFQRLQPERVSLVNQRMGAMLAHMSPGDARAAETVHVEKVDDLIRQAEATVGERKRTILLMRASDAAMQQNDLEKALAVAELISDLYERKIQTSLVLFRAAMKEMQEGRRERAYTFARQIEFLPQRVVVFTRLAEELWADKQADAAESKITEIWAWVNKADNTPQKIDSMLKLTALIAARDSVRAFEWLHTTARALNTTDFSSAPVDLNRISVELQITLDMLDLESSFGPLAKVDFERAFAIAHSLTKPEAALLAETIVCTRVLQAR